ncbi:MAG: hypothetical protein QXK78_00915 [Candidatus Bathyarchaeia archaeon]
MIKMLRSDKARSRALALLFISFFWDVAFNRHKFVNAYYGSGVFCPNLYIPENPLGDTYNEIVLPTYTCYYIAMYLWEHYYPGYCYFYYGDPFDGDPVVTASTYSNTLYALEQSSDKVTVFSKGHCTPWGTYGVHYQLLCTFYPDAAKDSIHIFPYTNQAKCRFCFIWHCGTARSYPVPPPYRDVDGPIGLPLAFTHNAAMTKYGTSGPCVYLGWIWLSPQFESEIPGHPPWQYAHFACYFFYRMHYYGLDVWYTLNYLAQEIYGIYDFESCPLYDSLIVWGNRYMTLNY